MTHRKFKIIITLVSFIFIGWLFSGGNQTMVDYHYHKWMVNCMETAPSSIHEEKEYCYQKRKMVKGMKKYED